MATLRLRRLAWGDMEGWAYEANKVGWGDGGNPAKPPDAYEEEPPFRPTKEHMFVEQEGVSPCSAIRNVVGEHE